MRIAIDLTALMPKPTGVDVYLTELVRHLAMVDRENRYTVFVNAGDGVRIEHGLGPNVRVRACCLRPRPARALFQQCLLPAISAAARYDVIHSPSFLAPWWRGPGKHLLSVHDMTFFSMPELHNRLRSSRLFRMAVATSIRRAHMVAVPSEAVRRDVLAWMPRARVRVTPYGVDSRFTPSPAGEVERHARRLGLPRPYILYVGTIEPRKNTGTLLEAYRQLVSSGYTGVSLVLAGGLGWGFKDVLRKADAPDLRGRVRLTGYVPDEDLPWVYRAASLFVYPSLHEGFGFPPLEAMACGVPVIASSGSALGENLDGAAVLVEPREPQVLAEAMRRLLEDDERRARLSRAGLARAACFRWEETARRVLECYRELAAERSREP